MALLLFLAFILMTKSLQANDPKDRLKDNVNEEKKQNQTDALSGIVLPKLSDNEPEKSSVSDDINKSLFTEKTEGEPEYIMFSDRNIQKPKTPDNPNDPGSTESRPKRKWSENSMSVWGKRKDSAAFMHLREFAKRLWKKQEKTEESKNNLISSKSSSGQINSDSFNQEKNKNKLSDNGKDYIVSSLVPSDSSINCKRRWSDNSMSVWGKKQSIMQLQDCSDLNTRNTKLRKKHLMKRHVFNYDRFTDIRLKRLLNKNRHRNDGEPKRNWATNTMDVWGKRDNHFPDSTYNWNDVNQNPNQYF